MISACFSISESEYQRYVAGIEESLSRLHRLDPLTIVRTIQPKTAASMYRPAMLQNTLDLLRSLEGAQGILLEFSGRVGIDPQRGWQGFLAGIDQMLDQGVTLSPEKVARRVVELPFPRNFPVDLLHPALRRLTVVLGANTLDQIRRLPGNRLEVLQQLSQSTPTYCIRINDVWRIGFKFSRGTASEVGLLNYH